MDEASLCERVALMQNGKILAIDSPEKINTNFEKKLWAVRADDRFSLLRTLQNWQQVHSCYSFGEYFHVVMKDEKLNNTTIEKYLAENNFQNIDIKLIQPGIEDSFMALMNN
jgi:ABC-type multidrug transport system ATPase subunit